MMKIIKEWQARSGMGPEEFQQEIFKCACVLGSLALEKRQDGRDTLVFTALDKEGGGTTVMTIRRFHA